MKLAVIVFSVVFLGVCAMIAAPSLPVEREDFKRGWELGQQYLSALNRIGAGVEALREDRVKYACGK